MSRDLLLVEDNPADAALVRDLLGHPTRPVDWTIHGADGLKAALDALRARSFEVVLLDLHVPDGEGEEVIRRVRAAVPHTAIVAFTGHGRGQEVAVALHAGADGYLLKDEMSGDIIDRAIAYAVDRRGTVLELDARTRELEAALEREKALAQSRARLFAQISHELSNAMTPLTVKLFLCQSGECGDADPRYRAALGAMDGALDRVLGIVRDLRDVGRIETGNLRVNPRPMDLDRAVAEVVETYECLARKSGLDVVGETPRRLPIVADPTRVDQILVNLLSNALKYSPSSGRVVVSATEEDGRAVVRIRDEGPGLTAEQIARLFQPFGQVQAGPSQKEGSGLGLYISRGFVAQLGGEMGAASDGPGRGATFWFAFPVLKEDPR